uniref:AT-rich interactive domain-containing protein 2-like n=1 Tax=Erigeron canadensis TaxID=72917 RepID=UPI001CB8BF6B|nr:AT-rich interactive domain-containing protein 2-like [Erigeron canadensis]
MKSTLVDRFNYINDDKLQLAIPIGPRFQADVPDWRGPPHKNYPCGSLIKSDSSKWLGTVIWSTKNSTPVSEGDVIGKGRPASCNCATPGSILCVKHHISKKSANLLNNLGPAFQKWRFDQMGETIGKLWKQPEQQRLTNLIRKCALSGDEFLKPALECFPRKSKKDIVSYYFNVHIPRRMSIRTRSGCTKVDTDDEEEKSKPPCSKGPRKRARVDGMTGYSSKIVNTRYLTGRR